MDYDKMLEIVEDFENILTDLNIILNELIDEGETKLSEEAEKKYVSVSSRTFLLKEAPCKDIREACAKFDKNYDDFLMQNIESIREAVITFNNDLSNADLTQDKGLASPVNVPKDYIKSKGSSENEFIFSKGIHSEEELYSIIVKPYEERDYTLKDNEELVENNYGYTQNHNGFVYRVTRINNNKEKDCYNLDICLTLSDGAYDVICTFNGQRVRVSTFLARVHDGSIKDVDPNAIDNLSSDELEAEAYKVDYDKYIDGPLTEARNVLKFIYENN